MNPSTYRGHVENGVIVLDDDAKLPEGMKVVVATPDVELEKLDPVFTIGDLAIDLGIPDLARNIDHYLYGHPKVKTVGSSRVLVG